jgi:CheY-like chemotaxis protein/anti-sigma regulatory factor (Ser/Thr protein kinase)
MNKYNLKVVVTVTDNEVLNLPENQAVLLFQSVRELLINSSKYAGTHEASVHVEQRGGELTIEVKDQGAGFDLLAPTADSNSGTGFSSKFGLFSIRERMRALGGCFDIQSERGRGTCAVLTFPLERINESPQGSQHAIQGLRPGQRDRGYKKEASIRVLLVDDHAVVRQGLKSILTEYSEHSDVEIVAEAANGIEALCAVEAHRPAVVIMDINMSKMDGIEATACIKARYPEIQIIGLSVNSDTNNERAMLKAGE